ncbi:hypothetical protein COO60DRAFT_57811 [Scenedesmus sp. NREL 46B-D3]|nr:hypothetical protein COO60DRAFT_57811 [Scenedesmus sp. NREL 46B-D3]
MACLPFAAALECCCFFTWVCTSEAEHFEDCSHLLKKRGVQPPRRRGVCSHRGYKKRGYMVCTGDYVATNTRKQRELLEVQRKNRLSPKEAHPKKASVCET